MAKGDPFWLARQRGEEVARTHELKELPVDVKALAAKLQILVVPKPSDQAGVSGMLMRVGQNFGISYATHIESVGFQRFSIAHELGHYFLPGHIEAVFSDGEVHQSRAGFTSGDKFEIEADHFASGLLMPKALFMPALRKAGQGVAALLKLSTLCQTSLPATAIRYTHCTSDPMAIVVSTGRLIDYCFMSEELKEIKGIDWLKKRQAVPTGTPTADFNLDPQNVAAARRAEGTSSLPAWFGGNREIEMQEDVIGLGSYGKTLTVLYGLDLPDEEDEEEERSLQDSWAVKFRR